MLYEVKPSHRLGWVLGMALLMTPFVVSAADPATQDGWESLGSGQTEPQPQPYPQPQPQPFPQPQPYPTPYPQPPGYGAQPEPTVQPAQPPAFPAPPEPTEQPAQPPAFPAPPEQGQPVMPPAPETAPGGGAAWGPENAPRPSAADAGFTADARCGQPRVTLQARQTRGRAGINARIDWGYVKLPCPGQISQVYHDGGAGFWMWNNGRLLRFSSPNQGPGTMLEAGTVWLAPNLGQYQEVGSVSLAIDVAGAQGGPGGSLAQAIGGTWDTEAGTATFQASGSDVRGSFDGVVAMAGQLRGETVGGYWYYRDNHALCPVARNGTRYWGRIAMTFNRADNYQTMAAMIGPCEDNPTIGFSGRKRGTGSGRSDMAPGGNPGAVFRGLGMGQGGGPSPQSSPYQDQGTGGGGRFR